MFVDFEITVLKIFSANRLLKSPVGVTVQHPQRQRWALALKKEGRTYYTVGGKQIISDSQHPVLLPKGCSYSWICTEPGECLIVEFDAEQTCKEIIPFFVADNSFLLSGFGEIEQNLHNPAAASKMTCRYRLYSMLLRLMKNGGDYASSEKQQRLQPAVNFICQHYFLPNITNDQLAQLCRMSTVYFRKTFESVYGLPPIRWLNEFRIQKAKDLLSSDYGTIAQVAESVGYSSVYHFSKMFKQYTTLSPSQYAKNSTGLDF